MTGNKWVISMGNWLEKFLSFDRMMGEDLVRKTYYLGLLLIAGWAVLTVLGALFMVFSNFGAALSLVVTTPLIALFALMIWRVIAERLMLDWQDTEYAEEAADEDPIPGEVVNAATSQSPEEGIVDVEFEITEEDEIEIVETVEVEDSFQSDAEASEDQADEAFDAEEETETRP